MFRLRWPTTRADDRMAVEAAWNGLSVEDRRAAIDGIAPFLEAQRAIGRKVPISGATYLARRRWEAAIEAEAAAPKAAAEPGRYAPFSKLWWALMWRLGATGAPPPTLREMLRLAKMKIGARAPESEAARADVEGRAGRLVTVMTGEAAAKAWAAWFYARGADLDETFSGKAFAVFLPPGLPPPERADDDELR